MQDYFIKEMLGLKEAIVNDITCSDSYIKLRLHLPAKEHQCPRCKASTSKTHDYRIHTLKDLDVCGKTTLIYYRKRRYVCLQCGKRFDEQNPFVSRYQRFSKRVLPALLEELTSNFSMKSIARRFNVSTQTVSRILRALSYRPKELPEVLCIDEFKGDANGIKYQCILVDGHNRKLFDILPDRKSAYLEQYFSTFSKEQRRKVKYFVTDMWNVYALIAARFFPNATVIIDRFHYTRSCLWVLERVRKRLQKSLADPERRFFKRSRKLLLTRPDRLSDEAKIQLSYLLKRSEELRKAYCLTQTFMTFVHSRGELSAHNNLNRWIHTAQAYGIPEFKSLIRTLNNWREPILNSFKVSYSNGITEGLNNKIKVIKRNGFGISNFTTLRNRILHCCLW